MRLLPAGSLPWLLMHEIRLAFRLGSGRRRWLVSLILLALLTFMTIFTGLPLAQALAGKTLVPLAPINLGVDVGLLFVFTLLLSQTLTMTVLAFFERGDFDLLLSSPLPPSRILFVRALAIAVAPVLFYLVLLVPVVLPIAVLDDPRLFASFAVLTALALIAAAFGLMMAFGLMALMGPRRTKTFGQVLAALIGAAVFLVSQIPNFLPGFAGRFKNAWEWALSSGWFDAESPFAWPMRAALADPVPLIVIFGGAVLLFVATAKRLGRSFVALAAAAAGTSERKSTRKDRRPVRGFSGGIKRAMFVKETKLLLRDPALLSHVLLRVLYFVPLAYILLKRAPLGDSGTMLIAGSAAAIVFFVGQIASSLAWIAISGEDAPDLVKSAPVTEDNIAAAKLTATVWPVAALAAVPVGFLAFHHPWVGLVAAAGVYFSALSAGYINLWYEKPQRRSNFNRRGQGSIIVSLADMLFGFSMMAVTMLAASASWLALPLALIPVGILGLLYLGRRREA